MADSNDVLEGEDSLEPAPTRLTVPELRIVKHLATGATYRAIATELHLAPATVAFHAARLQRRLHVSNNVALVAAAIITGVLSTDTWPPQLTGLTELNPGLLGP